MGIREVRDKARSDGLNDVKKSMKGKTFIDYLIEEGDVLDENSLIHSGDEFWNDIVKGVRNKKVEEK